MTHLSFTLFRGVTIYIDYHIQREILTGISLIYQEILAGGNDFEDVQFKSNVSPTSYSSRRVPVICGPSFGKSENIDPIWTFHWIRTYTCILWDPGIHTCIYIYILRLDVMYWTDHRHTHSLKKWKAAGGRVTNSPIDLTRTIMHHQLPHVYIYI